MTDEVVTTAPAAPVVEAPVATPAVEVTTAPAAVAVEATPVTTAETPVAPTVLGEALAPTPEAKPVESTVEAPKVEAAKTEEVKVAEGQSDEPAPPPVYDAFTLPEGFKPEETQLKEFTDILSKFESESKTKHELVQKFGQEAVDFYSKGVQKAVEDLTKFYAKNWEDQKVAWKEAFQKDPDIGGNRWQTTVDSANTFIRTHGGTPEQIAEFRTLMDVSGLGNHPAMIRLLSQAGRAMSEGGPLAATAPMAPPKSKTATLYGSKKNYIT